MSVINTNITSMIGQSNLSKSQSSLATSMERLSSGLRINSAKDDAAGQAIANRMSSQITGLAQAQRNANDGISVAQTAESALGQVNDNVQRIRELTVQAQNGTNSQADLNSIQDEIDARVSEIDRISDETDFNGVKVLSGEKESISIQVGANDGETISINLEQINSESLGLSDFNVNNVVATAAGTATLTDGATFTVDGVTFEADTGGATTGAGSTTIGTGAITASTGTLYEGDNGELYIQEGDEFFEAELSGTVGTATTAASLSYVKVGGADAEAVEFVTTDAAEGKTADPLAALDSALSTIDTTRSDLGAIQNRFESAITNLDSNETNLAAARSRIEDADYAVEVANMTRAQILQQAGTSVLAQANQIPQNVLSLLG
ncbi:FliC/FljB family flagellin [Vreelandella alkaliphila]|uniref:FliC/FljB family flagellin n=1 Tax=Vreelandella alkaliphila TaxID=272774 RepID=UPI0039F613B7